MKIKIINMIVVFLGVVILAGCTSNRNKLALEWPGVNEDSQRARSLSVSSDSLQELTDPDVLIQLSHKDINEYLIPSLMHKFKEIKIDNANEIKINNIEIKLSEQAINFDGDLDIHITKPNLKINGKLSGLIAVATEKNNIFFYPILNSIELEDIDKSKIKIYWKDLKAPKEFWKKVKLKFGKKIALKVANAIFDNFMSTVNNVAFKEPFEMAINFNYNNDKSLKDLIKPKPIVGVTVNIIASEKPINPDIELGLSTVMVNKNSISVMADIDGSGNGDKTIDKLLNKINTGSDFVQNFTKFKLAFVAKQIKFFDHVNGSTEILIRKKAIARAFNKAVQSTKVSANDYLVQVTAEHSGLSKSYSGGVQLFKKEQINCESKRKSCANRRSCANTRSCGRNCSKFDLICKARAEACRVGARAEAEACRVGARAEAEACRVGQNLEVTNCKVKLEGLRVVEDFLDVAKYSVNGNVSGINAISSLKNIQLSDDLSKLSVKSHMDASAHADVRVHINPEGIGHLACLWKVNPQITAVAHAKQDINVNGQITSSKPSSDKLILGMNAKTDPVTLALEPNPLSTLMKNKDFRMSCSVLGFTMNAASLYDFLKPGKFPPDVSNALNGKYVYKGYDFDINHEINPLKITIAGHKIKLNPVWGKKSIGFSKQ